MALGERNKADLESAATLADMVATATAPPGVHRTRIADRYEILGLLGVGGMGTVYKVRDHELDETVALKLLSGNLADDADALARFRREVRIARKVTHPAVARTFDIGEHEGSRFLTMELVDGEALDARLARTRLGLHEIVAIASGLCDGLGAAHAAGVVHRDLKPANVIVAKDRVVVTDFGIARALESEGTKTTTIAGTPAYMAPEQVEGRELDGRADLYALGVMLFEMLTGELPFQGDSPVVLAAARLVRPAPDVLGRAPSTPAPIADLVRALLAKDRDARPATALAVKESLAAMSLPSVVPPPPPRSRPSPTTPPLGDGGHAQKAIAVLPFTTDSDDDAYLAEALAEEIADSLSSSPGLRVRPFGAAKIAAADGGDARAAGERLGVHVVLEGSLRRRAGVLRTNLRLITVADGFQIFADRFEVDGDPFARAAIAARAIASSLTESMKTLVRAKVTDPVAQDYYLRGRYLYRRTRHEANAQAVELLAEAYTRAPDDARICALYAMALGRALSWSPPRAGSLTPSELAARAVELDPDLPEAHLALATLALAEGRAVDAAKHLARAIASRHHVPPDAIGWRGELLSETGPIPAAMRGLEDAMALEPDLERNRISIARLFALRGDSAASERTLRELPRNAFDFGTTFITRARLALWAGDAALADRVEADYAQVKDRVPHVGEAVERLLEGARRSVPTGGKDELKERARRAMPDVPNVRMRALFEQMRAEIFASFDALDDAEGHAVEADRLGTIDILWFERCPVLGKLHGRSAFEAAKQRVAARARDVRMALVGADE